MLVLVADLSFVGYTAGNRWLYDVWYYSFSLYYQVFDTLVSTYPWDGSGSRCSFYIPAEKADFLFYDISKGYVKTHAYYDGYYLVDFIGAFRHFPFKGVGIRTLKFPLTVGEEWQAIDTCIYALGQKIPHPDGSIDTDTITDTLWYDTSYASLTRYVGDTLVVSLSPIRMNTKMTFTMPLDDTTLMCCVTAFSRFYGSVKYVEGLGLYELRIDSVVSYKSWGAINTITWDTTFYPPTYAANEPQFEVWQYVPTAVVERPPATDDPSITLTGRVLKSREDVEIYRVNGVLVARLKAGESLTLKTGVYLIRYEGGIQKVVIR
ncbi:MAG: hypothetical protein GXO29_00470 [Thermotogae bacterium]|nr:hypothetical protein [Thermotogota bacterium]